jgi:hypothetical protein
LKHPLKALFVFSLVDGTSCDVSVISFSIEDN